MVTSCVILNFNGAELTKNLVRSIENYNSIDYIIIIDNCSTDDSFKKLKKITSKKVHLLKTDRNGGYGYGNNFGIRYSWTELNAKRILICNPDVMFDEECVTSMLATLEKNDDYAAVSCIPVGKDGKRQANGFWNLTSSLKYVLRTCTLYSLFSKNVYSSPENYRENLLEVEADCVVGSLLMVNTHHMISKGMYDERMFLYCEETTLGIKFKNARLKTIVLIKLNYIHDHSLSIKSSLRSLVRRRKIVVNSKKLVINDYYREKGVKKIFLNSILSYAIIESYVITFLLSFLEFTKSKSLRQIS